MSLLPAAIPSDFRSALPADRGDSLCAAGLLLLGVWIDLKNGIKFMRQQEETEEKKKNVKTTYFLQAQASATATKPGSKVLMLHTLLRLLPILPHTIQSRSE